MAGWILGVFGCGGESAPAPAEEKLPPAKEACATTIGGCALLEDGRVACFGEFDPWVADMQATKLRCGSAYACVERADASVDCFGLESSKDFSEWEPPASVLPLSDWWVGRYAHGAGCGVGADQVLTCWPSQTFDGSVLAVDASYGHDCLFTLDPGGYLHAWFFGEPCASREDPPTNGVDHPPGGDKWRAVEAGVSHACALDYEGRANCWGGSYAVQAPPADVGFSEITSGFDASCGITNAGYIQCWGGPNPGYSWDTGNTNAGWMPDRVPAGPGWAHIAMSDRYACAVDREGQVECFGDHPIPTLKDALANPVEGPPEDGDKRRK